MNRYAQYNVIINGDREEYQLNKHFKLIESFLEKYIWINDLKTYHFAIHQEPTFQLIRNQFSFEQTRNMPGKNNLSYENYLSAENIKSLNYWEYEEEKIYGLMIYGRWDEMWESAKSKDIFVVTQGLLNYFKENQLTEYHDETVEELRKLNQLANVCSEYNYEIHFFNPDI